MMVSEGLLVVSVIISCFVYVCAFFYFFKLFIYLFICESDHKTCLTYYLLFFKMVFIYLYSSFVLVGSGFY